MTINPFRIILEPVKNLTPIFSYARWRFEILLYKNPQWPREVAFFY